MVKNKKESALSEATKVASYYIVIFIAVYYLANEKLQVDSFWYSASRYFLQGTSFLVIIFAFSWFRNEQYSIQDPERYWKERGFEADASSEEYEDLFKEFSLKYYSSSELKNRISDAFSTFMFVLDLLAIIIACFISWRMGIEKSQAIELWRFIPQIFLIFYFVVCVAIYGVCKVITNRVPGEARRARKIDPYFLIHPN